MTAKQIIDGIDVGECPYYCGHDICKNTCHHFSTPCEWVDVQNCTYKQFIQAEQTVVECHKYQTELEDKLEAKEQECEAYKMEADEGKEINAELKAENDKLKTYITSFDYLDALSNEQVAVLYTACIDELAIRGYETKYKTETSLLTRYRNALTEIKEIAKNGCYDDCGMPLDELSIILQKISEVLNV
jgi:DNA repair ATPase RecN